MVALRAGEHVVPGDDHCEAASASSEHIGHQIARTRPGGSTRADPRRQTLFQPNTPLGVRFGVSRMLGQMRKRSLAGGCWYGIGLCPCAMGGGSIP